MIEERGKRESKRWNKKDGDVWVRGDGKEDGRGKRKDGKKFKVNYFYNLVGRNCKKRKEKKNEGKF